MVQPKTDFKKTNATPERVPTAAELAARQKAKKATSTIDELRKLKEQNTKKEAGVPTAAELSKIKKDEPKIIIKRPANEILKREETKEKVAVYEEKPGPITRFKKFFFGN